VAASPATMVAKSDVSMHSANAGPVSPEVTAGPQLSKDEIKVLLDQIDRLTDMAAPDARGRNGFELKFGHLVARRALVGRGRNATLFWVLPMRQGRANAVKPACLAPSVALR
jgi:hypothetical protein